jgi:ubiquinone/menaquinone biosynthesis C-methylase UbiE
MNLTPKISCIKKYNTIKVNGYSNQDSNDLSISLIKSSTKEGKIVKHNPQKYKERSKSHFDEMSSDYSSTFAGKYTEPMHYALIKELDGKNIKALLDVGCGNGIFLSMVLDKFDVKVSGIDISPGMIEKSKELLDGRADLKVGDSEHLPWNNKSFDVVSCSASFHHYPGPELVLKEMKRVLRPGGILMIADPFTPNNLLRFFANILIKFSKGGDVRIYSQKEMQEMLEKCGFTLIKWETEGKRLKKYFVVISTSSA